MRALADDDEEGLGAPGRDPKADSDDEALAAVLDKVRKLSGSHAERRQRFMGDADDEDDAADEAEYDDDEDEDAENARYEDFFDPVNKGDDGVADHAEGVSTFFNIFRYSKAAHPVLLASNSTKQPEAGWHC